MARLHDTAQAGEGGALPPEEQRAILHRATREVEAGQVAIGVDISTDCDVRRANDSH